MSDLFQFWPTDLARKRVLDTPETAAFFNVSIPTLRRRYRSGKIPKPIKLCDRKLGWQLGTLIDCVESRTE
jgi:predicted DNA-binding transcriptional regulator AlpA